MRNLVIIFIFFISCGFKNINQSRFYNIESGSIAVLLPENLSNDITAEEMVRDIVVERFAKKGWFVVKRDDVDEKLRGIGITDGGQLSAVDPNELVNLFSTRYLCYLTINDFKFQNLGFVIIRKVELNMRIYDGIKKGFVFDETSSDQDTEIYTDPKKARDAFIKYNALKLVENIMKRPLYKQVVNAVDKIFRKF